MNIEQDIKGPDVKFAPPMAFILMMLLAYGMSLFFPVSISSGHSLADLGITGLQSQSPPLAVMDF